MPTASRWWPNCLAASCKGKPGSRRRLPGLYQRDRKGGGLFDARSRRIAPSFDGRFGEQAANSLNIGRIRIRLQFDTDDCMISKKFANRSNGMRGSPRHWIVNRDESVVIVNPVHHRAALPHDLRLPPHVSTCHGQQSDDDHQRPQAELKPAAFAFRRLGFGRVGWHGRIIRRHRQRGQGMRDGAGVRRIR